MTSTRRMGSIESEKAEAMLDAAESVLRDEGYPALTSRRIAEILGIKQRLVYYYFATMEDLVVESFKRSCGREIVRLREGIAAGCNPYEIWEAFINTSDARLISEFMAIANRSEGLHKAIVEFIEETREIHISALKGFVKQNPDKKLSIGPETLAVIGTALALTLNREKLLGIESGHQAVRDVVSQFLGQLAK